MNRNLAYYVFALFIGLLTFAMINKSYDDVPLDNCGYELVESDPNWDLYWKIIRSESQYGDALKRGDKEGMNRAFNTSVYYKNQLK